MRILAGLFLILLVGCRPDETCIPSGTTGTVVGKELAVRQSGDKMMEDYIVYIQRPDGMTCAVRTNPIFFNSLEIGHEKLFQNGVGHTPPR